MRFWTPLPFAWITTASNLTVSPDPVTGKYSLTGADAANLTITAHAPGYYSQAKVIDLSKDLTGKSRLCTCPPAGHKSTSLG